ncbi:serine/threonine-protein kinase [Polyangium jinanense]|uniref:Serine/threonine protein kinase n=1 Tax=Polyangium jinanense TaxID=2829994 RepID=A0A9X4AU05_9BACT|nr:serine/threonine-protein kinase [Polyangium jinanense]MDC3961271.1 serine/threonine protein kinase [Polyangium jinanense]MDC3984096.1 serine/threonine protein kinase [Polyangium jinanense]
MIGETLGQKYKLISLLGRGGMGAVYEAAHTETGARVAVKVLHHHLAEGEGLRRFRREAQAVSRIQSPHIVRILDTGTDEPSRNLYFVTELLEGEDLQRLIDRIGTLSLRGALGIASQVLRGLAAAHAARVVHRDIKPANLFLAREPNGTLTVKILDFGIAKVRAEPLGLGQTTDLTATGNLLGSPLYMSPEQVQNSRDVDHRTDLWSLGCVLYAALAGRAPHQHLSSIGQLLVAICVTPARSLVEVAPWVPADVAAVVERALAIPAESRPQSAEEMLSELARFVSPGEVLREDLLATGDRARGVVGSSTPPSPPSSMSTPRFVVPPSSERPIRGDEPTAWAGSITEMAPSEGPRSAARSAVPKLPTRVAGRHVTVDPRRFLGEQSELWTFSLDVHTHLSSLIARIWKALRRAGAKVPPMTYGTEWILFEPRTKRFVEDDPCEGGERLSLEAAGIRPGAVLWVMTPAERGTA